MITVRCADCKSDVVIKKELYEHKKKIVCAKCRDLIIIRGYQKFGRAYWGGSKIGKVEMTEE